MFKHKEKQELCFKIANAYQEKAVQVIRDDADMWRPAGGQSSGPADLKIVAGALSYSCTYVTQASNYKHLANALRLYITSKSQLEHTLRELPIDQDLLRANINLFGMTIMHEGLSRAEVISKKPLASN